MKMLQSEWEKEHNYSISFQIAIMMACEEANLVNLKKLNSIYPEIVAAFICTPHKGSLPD